MAHFFIITTLFNPLEYKSRYRLYADFKKKIADAGGTLVTVELAFRGQRFVVTESGNPHHIQLHANHYIWFKENLVNIALRRLPAGWTHAAWLDADIAFVRPDWVEATLAALEQRAIVQMFTHEIDLGPNYEPLKSHEGFAYRHSREPPALDGQPGYAWAARREAIEAMGGLIDWSILGSNDHFMARALAGTLDAESTRMPGSNYAAMLLDWQRRVRQIAQPGIGFVNTTLLHYWHGRRADRGYDRRWRILVDNAFDPQADLRYSPEGVLELADNKPRLHQAIRTYFEARNEDNTEL